MSSCESISLNFKKPSYVGHVKGKITKHIAKYDTQTFGHAVQEIILKLCDIVLPLIGLISSCLPLFISNIAWLPFVGVGVMIVVLIIKMIVEGKVNQQRKREEIYKNLDRMVDQEHLKAMHPITRADVPKDHRWYSDILPLTPENQIETKYPERCPTSTQWVHRYSGTKTFAQNNKQPVLDLEADLLLKIYAAAGLSEGEVGIGNSGGKENFAQAHKDIIKLKRNIQACGNSLGLYGFSEESVSAEKKWNEYLEQKKVSIEEKERLKQLDLFEMECGSKGKKYKEKLESYLSQKVEERAEKESLNAKRSASLTQRNPLYGIEISLDSKLNSVCRKGFEAQNPIVKELLDSEIKLLAGEGALAEIFRKKRKKSEVEPINKELSNKSSITEEAFVENEEQLFSKCYMYLGLLRISNELSSKLERAYQDWTYAYLFERNEKLKNYYIKLSNEFNTEFQNIKNDTQALRQAIQDDDKTVIKKKLQSLDFKRNRLFRLSTQMESLTWMLISAQQNDLCVKVKKCHDRLLKCWQKMAENEGILNAQKSLSATKMQKHMHEKRTCQNCIDKLQNFEKQLKLLSEKQMTSPEREQILSSLKRDMNKLLNQEIPNLERSFTLEKEVSVLRAVKEVLTQNIPKATAKALWPRRTKINRPNDLKQTFYPDTRNLSKRILLAHQRLDLCHEKIKELPTSQDVNNFDNQYQMLLKRLNTIELDFEGINEEKIPFKEKIAKIEALKKDLSILLDNTLPLQMSLGIVISQTSIQLNTSRKVYVIDKKLAEVDHHMVVAHRIDTLILGAVISIILLGLEGIFFYWFPNTKVLAVVISIQGTVSFVKLGIQFWLPFKNKAKKQLQMQRHFLQFPNKVEPAGAHAEIERLYKTADRLGLEGIALTDAKIRAAGRLKLDAKIRATGARGSLNRSQKTDADCINSFDSEIMNKNAETFEELQKQYDFIFNKITTINKQIKQIKNNYENGKSSRKKSWDKYLIISKHYRMNILNEIRAWNAIDPFIINTVEQEINTPTHPDVVAIFSRHLKLEEYFEDFKKLDNIPTLNDFTSYKKFLDYYNAATMNEPISFDNELKLELQTFALKNILNLLDMISEDSPYHTQKEKLKQSCHELEEKGRRDNIIYYSEEIIYRFKKRFMEEQCCRLEKILKNDLSPKMKQLKDHSVDPLPLLIQESQEDVEKSQKAYDYLRLWIENNQKNDEVWKKESDDDDEIREKIADLNTIDRKSLYWALPNRFHSTIL